MKSNILLVAGSALIAYGPVLALFACLVYQKAQLVIVVTTSAFFYLLSNLVASIAWRILDVIGLQGDGLAAILPGVFFQFVFRCLFVALYHKVERVIQLSLEKQNEEELDQWKSDGSYVNNFENNHNAPPADIGTRAGRIYDDNYERSNIEEEHEKLTWTEAAKLRLQLNDASCGVAAGIGYGGMHAVLLYGTLLASETGDDRGVLYQDFCPNMPSLTVSALYSFCFSILDIFWMLFTFFGMRRRLLYHRGERASNQITGVGAILGNSRNGGNVALLLCLATHLMASIATLANLYHYGCLVSLPLVGAVVLLTAYLFWAGVGRIYMPPMMPSVQQQPGATPFPRRRLSERDSAVAADTKTPLASGSSRRRLSGSGGGSHQGSTGLRQMN